MSSETHITALLIRPDRTHEVQAVYGWTRNPELHAADVTFFCNEEGKLENQPRNDRATALWWYLNPDARGVDYLCGVVVVTGGANGNGDTLSVPSRVVEMVGQVGA